MEPKIGKLDSAAHDAKRKASRDADVARLNAGQVVQNGIIGHRIRAIGGKPLKR